METKEYKIFFFHKEDKNIGENVEKINKNSNNIKITIENEDFEKVHYFIINIRTKFCVEFYYCCLLRNGIFINEEWYLESLKNEKWENFEEKYHFNFPGKNYREFGIQILSIFDRIEPTCFVFIEEGHHPNNFSEYITKILKKIYFQNIVFNDYDFHKRNFKKDHLVYCLFGKFISNQVLEFVEEDAIENENIKLIQLSWLFDSIQYGYNLHIGNYKIKIDVESKKIFFEKKWFLKQVVPFKDFTFDLKKEKITIGRINSDLNLPSKSLSKNIGTLEYCQNQWKLVENEKNKNGIFLFKDKSYKRIKCYILQSDDLFSFGGGNNVPYGSVVKSLRKKQFTFSVHNEQDLQLQISKNNEKEKELENQLELLRDENKTLKDTISQRKRKRDEERFPRDFESKNIIVVVDTNVFIKYGINTFKNLKNFGILIPRVVFNELDNIKDNKTKMSNLNRDERKNLKEVTHHMIENIVSNWYIPSVDANDNALGNNAGRYNRDEEIIMTANYYKSLFTKKKMVIITLDKNNTIRGNSSKIETLFPSEFFKKFCK